MFDSYYWNNYHPETKPACAGELTLKQAYTKGKQAGRRASDLSDAEARFEARHCACPPAVKDCQARAAWYVGFMDISAL